MELHVRNVNEALSQGIRIMQWPSVRKVSPRGAATIEFDEAVITHYRNPMERVLFSPTRDANPFFHFFEALWMLAGRNDVAFVSSIVPHMKEFSDDGVHMGGAYGYRWRRMWYDQLSTIARLLRLDLDSRRAVLGMWGPMELVTQGPKAKDLPCNTQVYFKVRDEKLRMMVTCRSNDMLWGAYGANAVHFSMLQEYMADKIGDLELGPLTQVSDSFHVYLPPHPGGVLWERLKVCTDVAEHDYYTTSEATTWPMDASHESWDKDLARFFQLFDEGKPVIAADFDHDYFALLVTPMWQAYKNRDPEALLPLLPLDWALAGRQWLERRKK